MLTKFTRKEFKTRRFILIIKKIQSLAQNKSALRRNKVMGLFFCCCNKTPCPEATFNMFNLAYDPIESIIVQERENWE